MKVIILAGGRGTRLPESAKDKPKCLVEVKGKPILQHQLDFLAQHGLYDVRLSLGFRADQVIEYLKNAQNVFRPGQICLWRTRRAQLENVSRETFSNRDETFPSIDYIVEDKPLGTGGAIKFASNDLENDFIAINGDMLLTADLKSFITHHNETKERCGVLGSILANYTPDARDFGLIEHENGLIKAFLEKPKEKIAGHINAGVYILNKKIFSARGGSASGGHVKHFPEAFSIEHDVFPYLAKQSQLGVHLYSGDCVDLGTEERLKCFT